MTAGSTDRRIDDIEVLRGLSVLMILFSHLRLSLIPWEIPWWDHLTKYYFEFWPSVDLFFAISGFVIARTLLPMVRAGRAAGQAPRTLLAFWVRRAWRILPSAWLWLWIMLLQSAVFNRSGAADTFPAACLASRSSQVTRSWLRRNQDRFRHESRL